MPLRDKLRTLLPWQRKGYEVLEHYDTTDQTSGDKKVLAQLVARGADLSKERHIVHYLYFPDEVARERAVENLRERHYETFHGRDYQNMKSLIAERTGIVNEDAIEQERIQLEAVAAENGGEYDGWEAALDQETSMRWNIRGSNRNGFVSTI